MKPAADEIHECALKAERYLEECATKLAHAGFDPQITKVVGQMADAMRQIVAAMGKSQPQPAEQPAQPSMQSAVNETQSDLAARRGQA